MSDIMIGYTTVETHEHARKLAEGLIREKLAACVQMDKEIVAWFDWKDELECANEVRLAIKFPSDKAEAIKDWLDEHHPYDTPQWLTVKVKDTLPAYAQWVHDMTKRK